MTTPISSSTRLRALEPEWAFVAKETLSFQVLLRCDNFSQDLGRKLHSAPGSGVHHVDSHAWSFPGGD